MYKRRHIDNLSASKKTAGYGEPWQCVGVSRNQGCHMTENGACEEQKFLTALSRKIKPTTTQITPALRLKST